jgi:glycosyltransferase involved in cell wall biosynthesis
MYGVEIALELAARRPQIPFAFVESWPLADADVDALQAQLAARPNVELRRFVPTAQQLYADARVLLVPYRIPNRPRVVAEAHCNGIHVLASNLYGIAEAVGPGGVLIDLDDPIDAWVAGLDAIWTDPAYTAFSTAAAAFSERAEFQPEAVLANVEAALASVIADFADRA